MLRGGAERWPDYAVDIVRLEPRVADRIDGGLEQQLQFGLAGAATEGGFADADDTGFILK